jgi:hypothetical protein
MLVAAAIQVRSYRFTIASRVFLALGDIATEVAQYKIFPSWFPPSNGSASTLGLQLVIGKVGGFIEKSSANIMAMVVGNLGACVLSILTYSI